MKFLKILISAVKSINVILNAFSFSLWLFHFFFDPSFQCVTVKFNSPKKKIDSNTGNGILKTNIFSNCFDLFH